MEILGFSRWHRLDKARAKAIDAGWLWYEPPPSGSRGRKALYRTIIPETDGDNRASTQNVDAQARASTHASTHSSTQNVDAQGASIDAKRRTGIPRDPNTLLPLTPWAEAAKTLRKRIGAASRLIGPAQERGWTPEQLIAEADKAFRTLALRPNAAKAKSPAAAVYTYLLEGHWPFENVVTLEAAEAEAAQAEEARKRAQEANEKREAEAAAAAAEYARIEAAYGPQLDAMTLEQICELAPGHLQQLIRAKGQLTDLFRPSILKKMAEQAEGM
jgi:hypothetical protein